MNYAVGHAVIMPVSASALMSRMGSQRLMQKSTASLVAHAFAVFLKSTEEQSFRATMMCVMCNLFGPILTATKRERRFTSKSEIQTQKRKRRWSVVVLKQA
jgi:hypothetical protein